MYYTWDSGLDGISLTERAAIFDQAWELVSQAIKILGKPGMGAFTYDEHGGLHTPL
jgi:hypothetical protein